MEHVMERYPCLLCKHWEDYEGKSDVGHCSLHNITCTAHGVTCQEHSLDEELVAQKRLLDEYIPNEASRQIPYKDGVAKLTGINRYDFPYPGVATEGIYE